MIGYITLGTNDLEKAAQFYEAFLSEAGAVRFMESDRFIAWSFSGNRTGLSVIKPYDGNPATVGNGVMVAITVDSPEKVDSLYRKAIELGATDEGEPGPRGEIDGYYAAYFRDLDGNKLSVFNIQKPYS
jgi:predicted lactoylglutathione lyase